MANSLPVQVQNYLEGLEYPASKADVIDTAQDEGASDDLLDTMRDELPDAIFDGPADLSRAFGDSLSRR